jgi:putative DNA-invertase from lambdoid prophage Rac
VVKSLMKVALYARVSTHDQQTLSLQIKAMQQYVKKRGWTPTIQIKDVGSGATARPKRDQLMQAARKREIDAVIVWRLDRWGRSLADLVVTLKELSELGVGFVSLSEAVDLTTASGRAMVGMLAVFAQFENEIRSERVRAGIAEARLAGRPLGRPKTVGLKAIQIKQLFARGLSKSEIARQLGIGRTSVRRLLGSP